MTNKAMIDWAAQVYDYRKKVGVLPQGEVDLVGVLKELPPKDGWGSPITYQLVSTNRFRLSAISPYPHLDMFEYDSSKSPSDVEVVSF
jgi:hypothetical protein